MGVIYKITSPSGKVYVGKAIDLSKRVAGHKHRSKRLENNIILYNSIKKYGWGAHILEVVEAVSDNSLLNEREMFWIKEFDSYVYKNANGMNMTIGGDGNKGSWMHKIEQRQEQSKRVTGNGNPFYGKTHTQEVRDMLSSSASKRNRLNGTTVPKWGAEKGRLKVIKSVLCYGNDGLLVGEYESLTDADKKLNLPHHATASCIKRGNWYNGKYFFKYKTEGYPSKIEVGKIGLQKAKRPVLYIKGKKVKEYPSALEASLDLNVPKTSINRAACYNLGKPLRSGHIFIYKDLHAQLN